MFQQLGGAQLPVAVDESSEESFGVRVVGSPGTDPYDVPTGRRLPGGMGESAAVACFCLGGGDHFGGGFVLWVVPEPPDRGERVDERCGGSRRPRPGRGGRPRSFE
ncbi:hypothetical protein OG948_53085 (plasmid) [Embleya sp. NBC_00888]|uniref:hypothetical protein n=1 Tax=Embleya sp. NBC_00888 TaxID=2975960 RepID=UPI00386CA3AE|nr:hypothetical protein OG948_53085 [Embleya sp. NBC_00888]